MIEINPAAPPRRHAGISAYDHIDVDPEYPDLDGFDLTGVTLTFPGSRRLAVLRSRLADCTLVVDPSTVVEAHDAELVGLDLTGVRLGGLRRVRIDRSRLAAVDAAEAAWTDVVLADCALDGASLRAARLERVELVDGRADNLDLTGARLEDVRIDGIALAPITIDATWFERVDLRRADLRGIPDASALRGCVVDHVQVVELAAGLARSAGLVIADSSPSVSQI